MIPRFSPNYGFREVLKAFLPASPTAVSRLEAEMARRAGHAHGISFSYGRSGLYFLLKAINRPGHEVVLPSDTCVVVAHAIALAGYKPLFLDNNPGQRQPSAEDFLNSINSRTAMVIPTHIYGLPQETQSLYTKIKSLYPDIFVLQDCAHSYFCEDSTGSTVTRWGDGALFGSNISKLVNTVKGGFLTINDDGLAGKIRQHREQPIPSWRSRLYVLAAAIAFSFPFTLILHFLRRKTKLLSSQADYYHPEKIELPKDFRQALGNFSAEIGLLSLQKYDRRVQKRRQLAKLYTQILSKINSEDLLWFPPEIKGATWSHFPVLVPPQKRSKIIHELEDRLHAEIGVIVDYSVADLPSYKSSSQGCPRALQESQEIINLPLTWFETNLSKSYSFSKLRLMITTALNNTFQNTKEN